MAPTVLTKGNRVGGTSQRSGAGEPASRFGSDLTDTIRGPAVSTTALMSAEDLDIAAGTKVGYRALFAYRIPRVCVQSSTTLRESGYWELLLSAWSGVR